MTEQKKRSQKRTPEQRAQLRKQLTSNSLSDSAPSKSTVSKKRKVSKFEPHKILHILGISIVVLSVGYISSHFYSQLNEKKENSVEIKTNNKSNNVKLDSEKQPDFLTLEEPTVSGEEAVLKEGDRSYPIYENSSFPTDQKFETLTTKEKELVRSVLSHYSLSSEIREKSKNSNYSVNSLYSFLAADRKVDILNKDNSDLVINGYNYGFPIKINKYGVVDHIEDYSLPWRSGVRLYDKLVRIDNQPINPNANLKDIQSALFNSRYKSLTWYNGRNKKAFNTTTFKPEPIFGNLVTINLVGNNSDTLVLNIKKMTIYTPKLVANLIESYGKNKKGIVINLNDLQDFSYNGVAELVWLFNGQKVVKIAEITDHNGKTRSLESKGFSVSPTVLSTINHLGRIILVNNQTAGSAEILAGNISGLLNGYKTSGSDQKYSYYKINDEKLLQLSNEVVRNSTGGSVRVVPKFNKYVEH